MTPDFDPHPSDPIGERLRALTPQHADADTVLAGLGPRLRRAKRRRQGAITAIGALTLVSIAVFAMSTPGSGPTVDIRTPPAEHAPFGPIPAPDSTTSTTEPSVVTIPTVKNGGATTNGDHGSAPSTSTTKPHGSTTTTTHEGGDGHGSSGGSDGGTSGGPH